MLLSDSLIGEKRSVSGLTVWNKINGFKSQFSQLSVHKTHYYLSLRYNVRLQMRQTGGKLC